MDQETRELRRVGLKVTHPRMRILQIFEEEGVQHLTAEDVYKRLLAEHEDIGLRPAAPAAADPVSLPVPEPAE